MNSTDPFGNTIRSLLQSQGAGRSAATAAADAASFAVQNGLPPDDDQEAYAEQLADYLRQRGHNVNINRH